MLVCDYIVERIDGDVYKRQVVELLHFFRPEQKFGSLEQLKAQVGEDIVYGKEWLQTHPVIC